MEKKIALITGANRGLGLETARQLGEKGIAVILTARTLGAASLAASALSETGIEAYGAKLDVNSDEDRKQLASYISDKFGKLDILINNAGVGPVEGSLFTIKVSDTSQEEFEHVFRTNFFSVVYLTNELIPLLKKSDAGRIVNLSSLLGSLGTHGMENSRLATVKRLSYNASKTALNVFTNHLAAELADTNIKVNAVSPGWVRTDLGGSDAALSVSEGAKSGVDMALIGPDGPSGTFTHLGETVLW